VKLLKRLLIILLVLCLGVAAYFLPDFLFNKKIHAADLVSPDAVFVFETTEPVTAWNQLVSQPIWERLAALPSLDQLEDQLLSLDSLAGRSGNLEKLLKGHNFAVSLHQTGKEEFDFLFSITFSGKGQEEFTQSLLEKINPENIHSRNHSGVRIFEYDNPSGTAVFSYALIDNLVLASYSSFLIEDAIRQTETNELETFKSTYPELFEAQPEPQGLGVLRLSSRGVAGLVRGISGGKADASMEIFSKNDLSANVELQLADNKIVFEGRSFFASGEQVDLTGNQTDKSQSFSNYISNRTAIFHQYDMSGPIEVKAIPSQAFEYKGTLTGELERGFQSDLFFERLTGEMGYMILEENGQAEMDKILLLKTASVEEQLDLIKEFNLNYVEGDPEQLGYDFYSGREIFVVGAEEFPAHIFEGKFVGFRNTYVFAFENMLVFGSNMNAVKIFLDDVHNDNTWGKSIHHKKFIDSQDQEGGYYFTLNVPRIWPSLVSMSSPDWKVLFQKYAPQLNSIDWLSLRQNGQTTHIEFRYNLDPIKSITDIVLAESMTVAFNDRLIYGPRVIRNFNDKSSDYLVQDELHQVHLVSDDENIIFSYPLDGPIVSDVFQIDFYKNGKLQMLFATENAIYAFDRLGTLLPGYPFRLPSGAAISHLNLVDYDNKLEYRYFVSNVIGELFLFDKHGNNLEGWAPKDISNMPATTPAHHRLWGKGDFMVALNTSGELYLMNRKGELRTGSPIKLGAGVSTNYTLIERGNASEAQLVTINEEGEVVSVNFNGELTYRNQLLRPDKNTKFHLIKDPSNNGYLFVLHEYNKISVLNADAEPLFEKGMFSDDLSFQYYSFGGDKNIFVVIDKIQEFIYLYNLQGELLNTRPINGYENVAIKYSGSNNEYSILAIHGNHLSEYKMPL
jgi:hypothetical protein